MDAAPLPGEAWLVVRSRRDTAPMVSAAAPAHGVGWAFEPRRDSYSRSTAPELIHAAPTAAIAKQAAVGELEHDVETTERMARDRRLSAVSIEIADGALLAALSVG